MLEGEIREINLIARLVELWREQFTGAIRFENDGIIKIIYFKGGDVLSASTNDRADSVDEILMRAGKITREHVKQALAKRKESETLGDALLNLGFITRKELTWGRRMQAISVIRSIEQWQTGSFTIVADYLPKREEGTIFSLPQIIVEMTVTEQDRTKLERALDAGSAVFAKMPGFDEAFRGLGLNEDAEAVVRQVDGVRSASEIAAAARQDAFNSFKLLHALTLLGLLHKTKAFGAPTADDGGFEAFGVSDAADALAVEEPPPPPPTIEMALPERTPAWDVVPPAASVIAPAPEPPAEAEEERIPPAVAPAPRAARRPPTKPAVEEREPRRFGLLVALMIVFIVAGVAYGAFYWWNGQQPAASLSPIRKVKRMNGAPVSPPAPPVAVATTTTATTPAVAEPPAVMTTTVAPPPPKRTGEDSGAPKKQSGSVAERYASMAKEFAQSPDGNFTVQFEIVCEAGNITKAVQAGGANVWFVPISLKGRACYRVFWGHYDTRAAAERGMAAIPRALREATPSVVSVPR